MKTVFQIAIIGAVACGGAAVQWKSVPDPAKPMVVACDPAALPPDEVCLATVLEQGDDGLLWIDARSAGEWKADGLSGSVHLTSVGGEDFDELLAGLLPRLQEAKRVVVYCGSTSCGLSKEVISRLTQDGLIPGVIADAKALHGGHDALKAAGLLKRPS